MGFVFLLICSILLQKIYMEVGTPVSNKYYLGGPSGEMYGLNQTLSRFSPEAITALRCDTDIPGLYLTGDCHLCLLVYSWICVLRNHWNVSSYHMHRSDHSLGWAWFGKYVSRHADVHTYRYIHTCMHARAPPHTHTHTPTYTHTHIAHTCKHMYVDMHAYIHSETHSYSLMLWNTCKFCCTSIKLWWHECVQLAYMSVAFP